MVTMVTRVAMLLPLLVPLALSTKYGHLRRHHGDWLVEGGLKTAPTASAGPSELHPPISLVV
jgi:hypothetical protein